MESNDTDVKILLQAFGQAFGAEPGGDTSVPAPAPSTTAPFAEGQVTADKAIADLVKLYRALQLQAGRILSVFGVSAPCDVINRHHAAVDLYRTVATQVLGQLAKQGFTVVQQLYSADGKMMGDQKGPTPVVPPLFESCNKAAGALGFARSGQWGNVVINIGTVDQNGIRPLVAWIAIQLVANGTVVSVTHSIVVNWPASDVQQIEAAGAAMDTYLSCVERSLGTPNVTHEQADAFCRGLPAPPPAAAAMVISPTMFLVLGLLAVSAVGGYVLYRAYKRDEAEGPHLEPVDETDPELAPDELAPAAEMGAADLSTDLVPMDDFPPLDDAALELAFAELEDSDEPRYFRRRA